MDIQLKNSTSHAACFDQSSPDEACLYVVLDGAVDVDARLAVVDLNTEGVLGEYPLPQSSGCWSLTRSTDGRLYAGSYGKGHVYCYTPGSGMIELLGKPTAAASFVYGLSPGPDGCIYGGTYPDAVLFSYRPFEGFTPLTPSSIIPGEAYIRSTAHHGICQVSYVGVGAHAHLVKYDHRTGTCKELFADMFADEQFVYDVQVIGDRLFVRVTPSFRILVFALKPEGEGRVSESYEREIAAVASCGVSPSYEGEVFYTTKDGMLHAFDVTTGTSRRVEVAGVSHVLAFSWIRLRDQERFPGVTLIGVGNRLGQTMVFRYNLLTKRMSIFPLDTEGAPTTIQSIQRGLDGNLYLSGFLVGGTGIYNPRTHQFTEYKGVGQTESIASLYGKIYFGVYPSAKLYEYDPALPWTLHEGGGNPAHLFDLHQEKQSRPYGLAAGDGKLYMGTVCNPGRLGGVLAIYDPVTNQRSVLHDPLPDLSIICLIYHEGKVYGGTSVWGGQGRRPSREEAQLLVYDSTKESVRGISLPVPGLKAVTALVIGPDACIWGMSEGYLFVFDPGTKEFVYMSQAFADVTYDGSRNIWSDAALQLGRDGHVYGTIHGRYFFRLDSVTKEVTLLDDTGAKYLAQDDYGNMYYSDGKTRLKRFEVKDQN